MRTSKYIQYYPPTFISLLSHTRHRKNHGVQQWVGGCALSVYRGSWSTYVVPVIAQHKTSANNQHQINAYSTASLVQGNCLCRTLVSTELVSL